MSTCVSCDRNLSGRQTKYCSSDCKNHVLQVYEAQKIRGRERKLELVGIHGGCCTECGYKKNLAALSFHHVGGKDFKLDMRSLSNRKWEVSLEESNRCILLCANCHMEHHNPQFALTI